LACLAARPDIALRSAGVRSVWGSSEISFRDGFREPLGAGWIIDRRGFEELLSTRAMEAGAEWVWGARVHAANRSDAGWRVRSSSRTADGLHGRVIIDASGRPASIARRLGARHIQHESQIANVVAWQIARPSEAAWISVESEPDGWWYATLGPDGSQFLVWFKDSTAVQAGAGRLHANMSEAFAATRFMRSIVPSPPRLGLIRQAVASAGSAALDRSAGEGWLAVGDAAAAFDPLSSQGLSNAIASAEAAAHAAHRWIGGDSEALNAYSARMTSAYGLYRRGLLNHYRSEKRWRDRPFWRRFR
jgi:flavin-dependent dehydrogenase